MTDTQSPPLPEQLPSVVGSITVGGDASGLSAIGTNITQVHVGRLGNLVTPAAGPPAVERRPAPVLALGRRPTRFLDRESETAAGASAARAGGVVEFSGPDGAGKSTLLRELAHRLADDARRGERAAVVLLDASAQPLEDVLQELFGLLHATDRPYLPTGGELRGHLQGLHAIVLVDDVDEQRDVVRLMDVLEDSGLVLTSGCTHGVRDVLPLPLRGLPADDAAAVVRGSSTPGPPAQERAVGELVQHLGGRPGALAMVGAGAGLGSTPLQALARTADPRVASLEALPGPARQVLAVLAAVPGLALTAQEVSAATAQPAQVALDALVQRGLVDELTTDSRTPDALSAPTPDGPTRYRATVSASQSVRAGADLAAEEQALLRVLDDRLHDPCAPPPTVQEAQAVRLVLLAASRRGRRREVLRLGRAIEPVLALAGSWGSWCQVLTAMLAAARQLHDAEAESFALHQLGTRALSLGQLDEAQQLLTEALRLRRDAHDLDGVAVTEHNLRLLTATPVPTGTRWRSRVRRLLPTSRRSLLLLVLAVMALLVVAAVMVRSSLAGSGTPPPGPGRWQVTPASLDFGELPRGSTTARSLSLTSALDAGTAVRDLRVAGPDAADFRVLRNDCGRAPGQGRACQITVAFSPGGLDERQGRLDVQGEDGRSASLPLLGRGTAAGGVAELTPPALDFGEVALGTTAGPRSVTVVNTGDAPLALGAASVEGRHPDEFRVDDRCPDRLAPGDRCELLVRHRPTAPGARTATLTGGTGGVVSVPLTGTGVRAVDTTGPVITVADLTVGATSPDGAVVDLAATATDAVDGTVSVHCEPGSGQFALGTTEVVCRAEDRSGNDAEEAVTVTVADSTPPVLELPTPDPVEATSPAGAVVGYARPTARDAVDGQVPVECSPATGTTFPMGTTSVRCSAADEAGNPATGTFAVEVRDTTPPTIGDPPRTVVAFADTQEGTAVQYGPPEAEDLGEPATVTCSPPPGATFPLGETEVSCAADDGRGNTSAAVGFTVSVRRNVE